MTFQSTRKWDGKSRVVSQISGKLDSKRATDPLRRLVNGWTRHLEGTPTNMSPKMMPVTALSVTKAELHAAVQCVQDMTFAMRLMMLTGLKVEPLGNEGAVDERNNWTVGGQTTLPLQIKGEWHPQDPMEKR